LALGDVTGGERARALDCAGFLARYQGDYTAAAGLIGESLSIWRSLGDRNGIADALSNLGFVALYQGDTAAARARYEESLELNRALSNEQGRADCLSHLGTAAWYERDYDAARALHLESLTIWRALGDIEGIVYAQYHLGDVALAQGETIAAAQYFAESLTAAHKLAWPLGLVSALEGVARIAAEPRTTVTLAGFAAAGRRTVVLPLVRGREQLLAQRLQAARQALGEEEYAAAWAEGEGLATEEAVARSLAVLTAHELEVGQPVEPSSSHPADALTAREREVVRLIAEGRSNREIALALVVTVKTVEAHNTRILAKLGFTSRAQIAAWAVAEGLAPGPSRPPHS
jgi:non-specific serine/threonine protein kinase